MIVPTRRWYQGAALLALVAPLALVWPSAVRLLVTLDVLWIVALLVDAWRGASIGASTFEMERQAPTTFSVDHNVEVVYRWVSRAARPLQLVIREEAPTRIALHVAAERSLHLLPNAPSLELLSVRPTTRGRVTGGVLHIRVAAPIGLAWRQLRLALPWKGTVYPNLAPSSLRPLPSQLQRRREAGLRAVRHLGEGRVFESLREWVPGDDTRTIDWKATAKRGKPMARQYEDERRQQVLIVIDAGRTMTAEIDGKARLESVVDAALRLAISAVEHDDNVGLLVFSDLIDHWIAPARGRRALRTILDALAVVEGKLVEPDYPAAFAFLAQHNRKRALTVIFTDVIDRTASESLVAQVGSLRPRHLPLTVALRDPSLDLLATARPTIVDEAFERAAAEELLQVREAALADMRSRGVLVLDVHPAATAESVVAQYELLKRRALL
ncbi:MAG: DUF58 domain-containing protein [Gemmatimonadaceae bacterium]